MIATVISADMDAVAQSAPGAKTRFVAVEHGRRARRACRAQPPVAGAARGPHGRLNADVCLSTGARRHSRGTRPRPGRDSSRRPLGLGGYASPTRAPDAPRHAALSRRPRGAAAGAVGVRHAACWPAIACSGASAATARCRCCRRRSRAARRRGSAPCRSRRATSTGSRRGAAASPPSCATLVISPAPGRLYVAGADGAFGLVADDVGDEPVEFRAVSFVQVTAPGVLTLERSPFLRDRRHAPGGHAPARRGSRIGRDLRRAGRRRARRAC